MEAEVLDAVKCPRCGLGVKVEIHPDEKPDGTILGYAEATCACGYELTEDEIYPYR